MQVQFILGPAGSGKTHRCLWEIRTALEAAPDGLPLLFIAPKQATFLLERQLLGTPGLAGFARLQILSFERLATWVLDQLQRSPSPMLSEEGRAMVLRALLGQKRQELKLFRSSARQPGFVTQLSGLLQELQRFQLSPERLLRLSNELPGHHQLDGKLHDLALLLDAYTQWLRDHGLVDCDSLLDQATAALRMDRASPLPLAVGGLWLDGFGDLSAQELDLLSALVPRCDRSTLAFCLERQPEEDPHWLSIWSGMSQTFRQCHSRLVSLPRCESAVEVLARLPQENRFAQNPVLGHLERHWTHPVPSAMGPEETGPSLRAVLCSNPEAEAILAAREILSFTRAGGRFLECAVLVRQLEGYHEVLRRVFTRYDIPFFLDRRESVAHHPLSELTRSALHTVAFGWKHDDWFGALKTGLVHPDEAGIDQLENEALARGWSGPMWLQPLPIEHDRNPPLHLEGLRQSILPPFAELYRSMACVQFRPHGPALAEALRRLWEEIKVGQTLGKWSEETGQRNHLTTWNEMNAWLDNLSLAFPQETMPLSEWLPILEAGLGGLSVGVIPPSLDQVLIGAVDRTRNPELRLTLLLGLNESVFPATPALDPLLNETDRDSLEQRGVRLGSSLRQRLGRERFLGYIACTRARERLVVSCSGRDGQERPLNPSPFLFQLLQLFPSLTLENFEVPRDWKLLLHPHEAVAPLLSARTRLGAPRRAIAHALEHWPAFATLRGQLRPFQPRPEREAIEPALAATLYGPVLHTSVSRLEQFAACPFRFFVHSGLKAEERQQFEVDLKELGSFQHLVLSRFHEAIKKAGRRWRDLTPEEAQRWIGEIALETTQSYHEGILNADIHRRLAAQSLIESLQRFAATAVNWMRHYEFEPQSAELGFGMGEGLPAWEVDLANNRRLSFRGIIDRVDLCPSPNAGESYCVVMDYKSSPKHLDAVLMANGLQLQLPAYLGVLRHLPQSRSWFGVNQLVPAGVFYVTLREALRVAKTRTDALAEPDPAQPGAHQHTGRFNFELLRHLDTRSEADTGLQFKYRLKKDGTPDRRVRDGLSAAEFSQLLDDVEGHLKRMGRAIYQGETAIDPYQKGATKACDQCGYHSICRIDSRSHPFRSLTPRSPTHSKPMGTTDHPA